MSYFIPAVSLFSLAMLEYMVVVVVDVTCCYTGTDIKTISRPRSPFKSIRILPFKTLKCMHCCITGDSPD